MADNITTPIAASTVIGTETVTMTPNPPAQVQQIKVLFGPLDTGTEVTTNTPFPVGGTALQAIQSGTPAALGQAPASGSMPVVLPVNQAPATVGTAMPTTTTSVGFTDGTNLRNATVTQNHNGDNQVPPSTGYGILVSSNTGILNSAGTVDRTRGTSFDGAPAVGIPAGNQYLQGAILITTLTGSVTGSGSIQTITVGSTTQMMVGDILKIVDGALTDYTQVITIPSATSITAIIKLSHTGGQTLNWAHYNVARDASVGDNQSPIGFSASATYLYNASTGLLELDKSADGERDGASGRGAATAAEYEWNAGGPLLSTGFASGLQFDRARSLQAKGIGAAVQNAGGGIGTTSITVSAASAVNSLQPGQQARLDRGTGTEEAVYLLNTYVPGTAILSLQSPLQFSHTNAVIEWDVFSSAGPGLNGFTAAGIGIEEEALYDPVSGKYYIERAATQDGMPPQNIVAESGVEWNGTSFDRMRTPGVWKSIPGIAITAGTPVSIWTPTGGKKFRIMGFALSSTTAGSIILKDAASEWVRTPLLLAATPFQSPPNMDNGYLSAVINNVLYADVTASGTISGFVFGTEE